MIFGGSGMTASVHEILRQRNNGKSLDSEKEYKLLNHLSLSEQKAFQLENSLSRQLGNLSSKFNNLWPPQPFASASGKKKYS